MSDTPVRPAPEQILREAEAYLRDHFGVCARYIEAEEHRVGCGACDWPKADHLVRQLLALLKAPPSSGSPAETLCNVCDQPIRHELVCEACLPARGFTPPLPSVPAWEAVAWHVIKIHGSERVMAFVEDVDRARARSEAAHEARIKQLERERDLQAVDLRRMLADFEAGDVVPRSLHFRELVKHDDDFHKRIADAEAALADARAEIARLTIAFQALVDRISNGHPQSIGGLDNVRMVQFGLDEIAQYRAAIDPQNP